MCGRSPSRPTAAAPSPAATTRWSGSGTSSRAILIREFHGHTEWVFSVAFSPDGRLAYSTSGGFMRDGWRDGTDSAIRVWDVETGQEVRKLEGHKGIVWSVAVSPDGRHVLSGGRT